MASYDSPDDAEAAFYAAFATVDLVAMGKVWLHGEQARCVHPGGDLLSGYAAVMQSWRSIFTNAKRPRVEFNPVDQLTTDTLAVHLVEERIGPAEADDQLTRILATNTYLRTAQGWRLVIHHATLPLVDDPPDAPGPAPTDRLH